MLLIVFWSIKRMKKFDVEYSTPFVSEMKYLKENGINYAFVKKINNVDVYKYKKTPELFHLLEEYFKKIN